jgi:sugar phosphate permease
MLTEAKHIRFLSILCFMVYFTSYVTRINFGAIVAEVVLAEGFLKSSVSFVITAGFISYGIGQLISGVVGDKVNPKKIIFWGQTVDK